jgi:hypothetical protein
MCKPRLFAVSKGDIVLAFARQKGYERKTLIVGAKSPFDALIKFGIAIGIVTVLSKGRATVRVLRGGFSRRASRRCSEK